jgi:hypothetical protein
MSSVLLIVLDGDQEVVLDHRIVSCDQGLLRVKCPVPENGGVEPSALLSSSTIERFISSEASILYVDPQGVDDSKPSVCSRSLDGPSAAERLNLTVLLKPAVPPNSSTEPEK